MKHWKSKTDEVNKRKTKEKEFIEIFMDEIQETRITISDILSERRLKFEIEDSNIVSEK